MKIKALFLSLLLLSGCRQVIKPSVTYNLNYVDEGSLKEITPFDVYESACVSKVDTVSLFAGLNGCSPCLTAKEETSEYAISHHVEIQYVDINHITFKESYTYASDEEYEKTDYFYIYLASIDGYLENASSSLALPRPEVASKNLELPILMFFKFGGLIKKVNADFSTNLRASINVVTSSEQ